MSNHDPYSSSANQQVVRSVLKKVHTTLDQNPDSFRPPSTGKLWLWRLAVAILALACIVVWFVLPALRS